MSEESEGSIGIEVGTSEVAPEGEQDVFAAGMWPDRSDAEGAEETPETPASTDGTPEAFDPEKVNLSRMNPEDVPEALRPMFAAAQRQFKGLQSTLNERDQELTTLRNGQQAPAQTGQAATEATQQQFVQPPQQVQPQQEQQPDPLNPYPYLNIPPAGPNFSMQERQEVIAGAHQVNQIFEHRLAPYMQYLEGMPQIVGALVDLVNRQSGADTKATTQNKQELIDAYGENAPDEPAVVALAGVVENPATGESFTYREAYERIHGITADQVREMEAKAKAAKAKAKQSGSATPSATTETPASGKGLTPEQAAANMKAAGWDN